MEIKEIYNYSLYDKYDIEDNEERRLFINGDIDCDVIDSVVYHILRYNRLDKGIAIENRKPILLYITSNGGSVVDGFSVIDAILASKTPIYTINLSYDYSMGFLIFIAGHKRFASQNATFLMHDGSSFAWDSSAKLRDRMDFETKQTEQKIKNYILDKSNLSTEKYDERYRIEWYFYSDEAKENGFVDYIIGQDCDIDEII